MSEKNFKIKPLEGLITLETIVEKDIEILRIWKNEHRQFFFYKGIISSEQQKKWFKEYMNRNDDFMFIIKCTDLQLGSIGFRFLEEYDSVEVYNPILNEKNPRLLDKKFPCKGLMGAALRLMLSYVLDNYKKDIIGRVLEINIAARNWLFKHGFYEEVKKKNYSILKLDIKNFRYLKYIVIENQSI